MLHRVISPNTGDTNASLYIMLFSLVLLWLCMWPLYALGISVEELKKAIAAEIAVRHHMNDVFIDLDTSTVGDKISVELVSVSFKPSGIFDVVVNNDIGDTIILHGKYEEGKKVLVTKSVIDSGVIIEDSMLDWAVVPISRKSSYIITDATEVIGKVARRKLPASKPIRAQDVKPQPLIHKSDIVTVRFEQKNLSIDVTGISLGTGGSGETIKIKNTNSSGIMQAVVVDSGLAVVRPSGK